MEKKIRYLLVFCQSLEKETLEYVIGGQNLHSNISLLTIQTYLTLTLLATLEYSTTSRVE